MASAQCYFLLVPFLVSFLFIYPVSSDTQQLIDHICRQVEEYGFCNKAFQENMQGPSTDIVGLTQITIKLATSNATNTLGFVTKLYQNASSEAEKYALLQCKYAYELVMEAFQEASKCFNRKDYSTMLKYERVTPREQATCVTNFNTPPYPPNPLKDRERQMRILITMAIATALELTS